MVRTATTEAWILLPVLDVLLQATDERRLVQDLLPRLRRLIRSDSVVWSVQNNGRWTVRSDPDGPSRTRFVRNDPLIALAHKRSGAAVRRSDLPDESGYQLAFCVEAGPGRRGCIVLSRVDPDYTPADLLIAEVVRPRLELAIRRVTPPGHPQWITARETAVLDLVVEGLTNRQIATRLGISPRTVGKHLEHSYAKLHEPCRVGAAMRWRAEGVLPADRAT